MSICYGSNSVIVVVLMSTRHYIPKLFTDDPDVIELTAKTLPLNAAFQLFDAVAALCNGILRGLGRQEVGGYINLFAYYVVRSCRRTLPLRYHSDSHDRLPCRSPLEQGSVSIGTSTVCGLGLLLHWGLSPGLKAGSSTIPAGRRRLKRLQKEMLLVSIASVFRLRRCSLVKDDCDKLEV